MLSTRFSLLFFVFRFNLVIPGNKVFSTMKADAPLSFKFVNMVLACTGGGILVPIFINGLPVPLAVDAVAIAITVSIFIHSNFPKIRTFLNSNGIFMVSRSLFVYKANNCTMRRWESQRMNFVEVCLNLHTETVHI